MNIKGIVKEVTTDTIEINGFIIFEPGGEYHVFTKEEWDSDDTNIFEFEFEEFIEALKYCIDKGEPNKDLTGCHLITIKDKDLLKVNGFYIVETPEKEYHVYSEENYNLEWFDNYENFKYPAESIYFCIKGKKVQT